MSVALKRRRTLSPKSSGKTPSIYKEILRVWSTLNLSQNTSHSFNKSRFLIFCGTAKETIVDIIKLDTSGLYSEIYEIYINQKLDNTLIKRFVSKELSKKVQNINVSPKLEAKMQHYASKFGLAPKVFAYSSKAMIMEKCQTLLMSKAFPDGYNWIKGLSSSEKKIIRPYQTQLNLLNQALGTGHQAILKFSRKMYENIGMYNLDPNIDNYMILNDKLVQIDFGMNRFKDVESFKRFNKTNSHDLQSILVPNNRPTWSPDYYWYEVFLANNNMEKIKKWPKEKWLSVDYVLQRQILLKKLEKKTLDIMSKKMITNKSLKTKIPITNAFFRIHCKS
jgi:hypothetical protein